MLAMLTRQRPCGAVKDAIDPVDAAASKRRVDQYRLLIVTKLMSRDALGA